MGAFTTRRSRPSRRRSSRRKSRRPPRPHRGLGERHGQRRARAAPPEAACPGSATPCSSWVTQAAGDRAAPAAGGAETSDPRRHRPGRRAHRAHRLDVGPRRRRRDHAVASRFTKAPRMTYLVHGEPPAQAALKERKSNGSSAGPACTSRVPGAGQDCERAGRCPYLPRAGDEAAVAAAVCGRLQRAERRARRR